jgi:hypothetical protein
MNTPSTSDTRRGRSRPRSLVWGVAAFLLLLPGGDAVHRRCGLERYGGALRCPPP